MAQAMGMGVLPRALSRSGGPGQLVLSVPPSMTEAVGAAGWSEGGQCDVDDPIQRGGLVGLGQDSQAGAGVQQELGRRARIDVGPDVAVAAPLVDAGRQDGDEALLDGMKCAGDLRVVAEAPYSDIGVRAGYAPASRSSMRVGPAGTQPRSSRVTVLVAARSMPKKVPIHPK
jgi:hypothetical protein